MNFLFEWHPNVYVCIQLNMHFKARICMQLITYILLSFPAVGCADEEVFPSGMSLIRHEDRSRILLRCNSTGEFWMMRCTGSQWTGSVGNCSTSSSSFSSSSSSASFSSSSSSCKHATKMSLESVNANVVWNGTSGMFRHTYMTPCLRRTLGVRLVLVGPGWFL